MVYSGVPENRRVCFGVAILRNNKWKEKIISYNHLKWIDDISLW